jgi:cytochrome P450
MNRTVDLSDLDLFVSGDPWGVWAWLRENDPVHWNETPDGGFWAITRYKDVVDVYTDTALFSSRHGTVLGGSYRSVTDTASSRMLICSDAPEHRLMRQQVHPAFLPAMLEKAGSVVERYVRHALDCFVKAGGGDFATEVAITLPAGLLAVMFGLAPDEAFHLLRLTRTMIGHMDPEYHCDGDMTLVAAQVEILELMSQLTRRRRRKPGDDLVSILLTAEVNGRRMSESELLYNCLNVAVGGDETTPFTATAAVQSMIEHPGEAERLLANPGLLPTAVEELFRWTSTNAYVQRTATRDTRIGGATIEEGASVTIWNASANRDEQQFPAADRFDVGRTPNHHVAFGTASHRCIGMGAARLEMSLLMAEIVARRLRFQPAGPVERLRSNFMLGIKHLPVTVIAG